MLARFKASATTYQQGLTPSSKMRHVDRLTLKVTSIQPSTLFSTVNRHTACIIIVDIFYLHA